MSWSEACLGFVHKYGSAAKAVAGAVLNVVAPGSAALVGLVNTACDAGQDLAQKQFEERLLGAVAQNGQEVARLGELFALLQGDLAKLCKTAHEESELTHQTIEIEASVRKALALDPNLLQSLRKLDALTSRFDCLEEQNRRLLEGQSEMLPILRRLNRMADFFEECLAAGLQPRDRIESMRQRQEAVADIQRGQGRAAKTQVVALGGRLKASASVHVLAAGAAVVAGNYPEVQAELGKAAGLKPGDAELGDLHRRATVMATSAKVGTSKHPTPTGTSPVRLQVGDNFDGWTLEARLGAGGWGQVFRARRGGEVRAIKVLHPELNGDPRFLERFRGEIRALASLPRHDNLVRLLDFNFSRQRDCWYLEMEYVDGPTLEQYLSQKGPLTVGQVLNVFPSVAEGLGLAHAAGLYHRDIKPSNLILRKSNRRLVLIDFGLAIQAADAGQTKIGGMTLQFAPLEQLRGQPANARSDVYSLAATMYFALLYDKPEVRGLFDADQAPAELRAMLIRALHPTNPTQRYANGGELALALRCPVVKAPVPVAVQTPAETAVQRLDRLKKGAAEVHEEALAHITLREFREAVAVLEGMRSEFLPYRDEKLYKQAVSERDRLEAQILNEAAQKLIEAQKYDDAVKLLEQMPTELRPYCNATLLQSAIANRSEQQRKMLAKEAQMQNDAARKLIEAQEYDEAVKILEQMPTELQAYRDSSLLRAAITSRDEQRQQQLVQEARMKNDEARTLAKKSEYSQACKVLEGMRDELLPYRDLELLAEVITAPDTLPRLNKAIEARLRTFDRTDEILPILLQTYLRLKPDHAAYGKLASGFPHPAIGNTVLTNSIGMKFMYVGCGTFQMGSPASEVARRSDEILRTVVLTWPFYLGVYPVTVSEFETFVSATNYQTGSSQKTWTWPGFAQDGRHPVVCVSWNDAQAMVKWLNEREVKSGLVYSLPTEAQWEYACRAGTQTAYFWGNNSARLDEYSWYNSNSRDRTYPVETKKPNPWGLWHMLGHVWEWCEDWYGNLSASLAIDPVGPPDGSSRVVRGGSWCDDARLCRSARRAGNDPSNRYTRSGFRLTVSPRS